MVDNKVKKTHQKNPAQIFSFFSFIKIFDLIEKTLRPDKTV